MTETKAKLRVDNELIAEFLEWKPDKVHGQKGAWKPTAATPEFIGLYSLRLFEESWDWLMPVVEKISLISTGDDDFFYPRTFGMRDADGNFLFRFNRHPLYTAKTLIEATHAAVVEFIKWYNQNKKQ